METEMDAKTLLAGIADQIRAHGYAVQVSFDPFDDGMHDQGKGVTQHDERIVTLNPRTMDPATDPAGAAEVLAHELAHIVLEHGSGRLAFSAGNVGEMLSEMYFGWSPTRAQREIEAEVAARLLMQHFGLDRHADYDDLDYVTDWANGPYGDDESGSELIAASLPAAQWAADSIATAVMT